MAGTTVTISLIGEHSSEKEGGDIYGRPKNAFIERELRATLYDRKGFPRSGLLGVVLPSIESKIYKGQYICETCGETHNYININDSTVIK